MGDQDLTNESPGGLLQDHDVCHNIHCTVQNMKRNGHRFVHKSQQSNSSCCQERLHWREKYKVLHSWHHYREEYTLDVNQVTNNLHTCGSQLNDLLSNEQMVRVSKKQKATDPDCYEVRHQNGSSQKIERNWEQRMCHSLTNDFVVPQLQFTHFFLQSMIFLDRAFQHQLEGNSLFGTTQPPSTKVAKGHSQVK